MRWRTVGTLPQAAEIVRRAGAPNAGVLLDALHLSRSGGQLSDVWSLEALDDTERSAVRRSRYIASPDRIIEEARHHRLPPGEGGAAC